jgi:AcrR family transcriptional regulator
MPRTLNSRGPSVRERRRARERSIVKATRALFDRRARRDAQVEEIARAAGISKALVYRAFDSKQEIFLLTLTDYLAELRRRSDELPEMRDRIVELRSICEIYADFCLEYPAFLDCALALMQRDAADLREQVSGTAWLRLGSALASNVGRLARVLQAGAQDGVFTVDDPDLAANRLCVQLLGSMHLARSGAGVRESAPGVADVFEIDPAHVRERSVGDALALAGVSAAA